VRVAIVGGADFIGPAIVEELLAAGHEPAVIHRGQHEPADLPAAPHFHCDRRDAATLRRVLLEARAEAVIDACAYARADAEALAQALPAGARAVVLSSMDVYRAFGSLLRGEATDAVPLDEEAPLREARHLYRGQRAPPLRGVDPESYEKIDVEQVARAAGATVLRLPVVYGPRDHLRREEMLLRRVRAGRLRIPFGAGNLLFARASVRTVAAAVRLAAEARGLRGEVLNVGERRTDSMEQWARRVLALTDSAAQLVRVPDARLPPDLRTTGTFAQHLLVDSSRARAQLGEFERDPAQALAESVRWHMQHPPADSSVDFSEDDAALASAS
jgi:nucleoside-diphosphate-sugar epimerase